MTQKLIFRLLYVLVVTYSYADSNNEASIHPQLKAVISTMSNLYENVKLASIVPYLINAVDEPDQYLTTVSIK
jgi:hypothetical protein